MNKITEEKWSYILLDDDGLLLLSVLCGTVGIYDTNIYLNEYEEGQYKVSGEAYIKELAGKIRMSPKSYHDRHVRIDYSQIKE
ncbi:MAG: hypothetical protein PQJ58_22125 [Spirochaetales bacterium]|nr:hypothetical protein [Spirochaetales bacterium]